MDIVVSKNGIKCAVFKMSDLQIRLFTPSIKAQIWCLKSYKSKKRNNPFGFKFKLDLWPVLNTNYRPRFGLVNSIVTRCVVCVEF